MDSKKFYKESGMTILIGDGVKASKEARKMPGVKKLHQESENSLKGEFIFGHIFGAIGVLTENSSKLFCIPLFINIQDGIRTIRNWIHPEENYKYNVVQMIENGFSTAKTMRKSILLLDRYFLSVSALKTLNTLNNTGEKLIQIVTKAKQSCIAYEQPEEYIGRGRLCKKKVNLSN
ncbi:MAG: hypothetical protein E7208_08210 [Clostridium butyricum]|nr:hypothetical protein [Clostridium butyricum]